MPQFKKIYKKCLRFLKLRKVLPRENINRVPIIENGDPLIKIEETTRLKLSYAIRNDFFIREQVYKLLTNAASNLPLGYTLIIVEAHRSIKRQQLLWNQIISKIKQSNPHADQEKIEQIARLSVAKPTNGGGGHQTGGAIDVTLGDKKGNQLFLGTKVQEFCLKTPTFSKNLTNSERELRKILFTTMKNSGFQNYPLEWWHYSNGDQLWAAYKGFKFAFYGPI